MRKSFNIILACLGCWANAQQPQWRYRELPSVLGLDIHALGINENGQIALQAYRTADYKSVAGRYSVGDGYEWGSFDGHRDFVTYGISRNGNVYGMATLPDNMTAVFTWNPVAGTTQYSPSWSTLMQNGVTIPEGCSDGGIVVTNLEYRSDSVLTVVHYPTARETAMNGSSLAKAMNASGLFVGQWHGSDPLTRTRPYLYDPLAGTVATLESNGQLYGGAHAINDSGEIFGIVSKQGAAAGWYGTWWNYGGAALRQVKLYDIGSSEFRDPHNAAGTSVQMSGNAEITYRLFPDSSGVPRPKFYSPLTGVVDIRDSIIGMPSGKRLTEITGITNSRVLTGYLQDEVGLTYSNFYLEPVPEPATLAALGIGLAAFLKKRRKVR